MADTVALVKRLKAERWVGFNDSKLRYMTEANRLASAIPVFWDLGTNTGIDDDIRTAKQHGFEALVLHFSGVTADKVRKVKATGLEIRAWTVNAPATMEDLLDIGVQRICANHPRRLLALKSDDTELLE